MSAVFSLIALATAAAVTQSQEEHVPPDPPASQVDHDMSYAEMARMMEMDDRSNYGKVLLDRFEWRDADDGGALSWNGEAWYGNDINKLWFKSEGTLVDGETDHARAELLWNRTHSRWWNLQAGLRHDFAGGQEQLSGSGKSRDWAALGVQGTAPGFFEIEATAYVGEEGRAAARFSVERDLLLTQRLILQPELELNAYSKADPSNGIGSGLSDLELGLRLRYELKREFAGYLGVVWARRFGDTASFARVAGDDPNEFQALAGLRLWF